MRTYAAVGEKSGHVGALLDCLVWALEKVEKGNEPIFQIVRCRAGEVEAKVIAQVHEDGIQPLQNPIYLKISGLLEGG